MSEASLLKRGARVVLPSGSVVIVQGMGRDTVALCYWDTYRATSSRPDLTVSREWFTKNARKG